MANDWPKAREIAAANDKIALNYGCQPEVSFEFEGVSIHNPFTTENQFDEVDPVAYYGEAFVESAFVQDPENALSRAQGQLARLEFEMGGVRV